MVPSTSKPRLSYRWIAGWLSENTISEMRLRFSQFSARVDQRLGQHPADTLPDRVAPGRDQVEIADMAVPRMLRLGDELPEPDHTLTGRLRHDLMGAESWTQSLLGLVRAGERNAHRPGDHMRTGEDVMDGFVVRLGHGPNGRVHCRSPLGRR